MLRCEIMTAILMKKTIQEKIRKTDELTNLFNKYTVFGLASLYKVRSRQLQEITKKLRSNVLMKVSKNFIVKKALKKCNKANADAIGKYLVGPNILIFTEMNPFKLSLLFEKSKVKTTAKAGDIAPYDLVIPAGNTGLPPGPAISELHEAGIRTRIQEGSVWVIRDTIVSEEGNVITPKIASVLSKMGVKPIEIRLTLEAAYDDGNIFTSDQLSLNLEETEAQIIDSMNRARNLAIKIAYPTHDTIFLIFQQAYFNAKNVALAIAYPTQELIIDLITNAYLKMLGLASQLSIMNKNAVPPELR
jgi:large subunit ribosomal protein L10